MRKVAGRALWIGNAGDLRDARSILSLGIEAVVELADNEPFVALPREIIRNRFPISDGGDNPAWLLRFAADSTATLILNDIPVLVCCSAGMSRSICVAAAGIALVERCPFVNAFNLITESGPADVSPRLFTQFKDVMANEHELKKS